MLVFIDGMLHLVSQHLLRGKYDPALTILTAIIDAFVKSTLVSNAYLNRLEEFKLADSVLRCAQRFADNEFSPYATIASNSPVK
jgi:hypothetical protein